MAAAATVAAVTTGAAGKRQVRDESIIDLLDSDDEPDGDEVRAAASGFLNLLWPCESVLPPHVLDRFS